MHINGNKGNGLKVMARYFQIPIEDTVAIGDENNDIPMLRQPACLLQWEMQLKKSKNIVTLLH